MKLVPHIVRSNSSRAATACAVAALLFAVAPRAAAQEPADEGTTVIPFPFFFYTPETGLAFGATVIWYRTLSGTDRSSTLQPTFVYTTNKQIILSLFTEAYMRAGDVRLVGDISYMRFPNTFWGLGNDAPDIAEEDYTPRLFSGKLDLQRRVTGSWFVGGNVLVAHRRLVETVTGGLLATAAIPGSADGLVASLGISVTRDSRDDNIYPRRGGYHQFRVTRSDGMIGSDYEFTSYEADVRQYVPVTASHVVVFRGLFQNTGGIPPFDLLPQLGGENLLRGYFAGRYRERKLLAFQSEYRLPVVWRLGAVGFVGIGQVANTVSKLAVDRFKTSAGFGIRFLLSGADQLNLRADFGFGEGSSGFYIGMGEVF